MMSAQLYIVAASLLLTLMFPASAPAQEIAKNSVNYQSLIRKNFELRSELQALEEKYQNLENERKVLIIHVKELQDAKSETEGRIQELKNMVASLRIEMLKDPKLTGRIEGLNKRIEAAVGERDRLQAKVAELEAEKRSFGLKKDGGLEQARQARAENEELVKEIERLRSGYGEDEVNLKKGFSDLELEKQDLAKKNQELMQELDEARRSLGQEEKSLKAELEKVRGEKNGLEEKINGILEDKETVRLSYAQSEDRLKAQIKEKEDEVGRLKQDIDNLNQNMAPRQRGGKDTGDEIARLKAEADKQLEKVQQERDSLKGQVESMKQEQESQRLAFLKAEEDLKNQIQQKENEIGLLRRDMNQVDDKIANFQAESKQAENRAQDLSKKLEEEQQMLAQQRQALDAKTQDLVEKNKQLMNDLERERALLSKAEGQWQAKVKDAQTNNVRFKKDLENAESAKEALNLKLAHLEQEVKENGEVNRRLMKDLKKEQTALERSDKALQLEAQKREIERETFDARLRNAIKDKALLETAVAQMEERVLAAETRREKALKQSEEDSAMLGLRDSEVTALREEKSRLEAKLLHYIEKNIARSQGWPSSLPDGLSEEADTAEEGTAERLAPRTMTRAQKIRMRMELAEKKLKMHYNLALAYDRMGMYREEEREYRKCLGINPKDANVHYNLAILYDDKLGMNDKAIHYYQKYLQLRPQGEESEWVKNWILYAEQEKRLSTKVK